MRTDAADTGAAIARAVRNAATGGGAPVDSDIGTGIVAVNLDVRADTECSEIPLTALEDGYLQHLGRDIQRVDHLPDPCEGLRRRSQEYLEALTRYRVICAQHRLDDGDDLLGRAVLQLYGRQRICQDRGHQQRYAEQSDKPFHRTYSLLQRGLASPRARDYGAGLIVNESCGAIWRAAFRKLRPIS